MNLQRLVSVAAFAAIAVVGFSLSSVAEEAIDETVEKDADAAVDEDAAFKHGLLDLVELSSGVMERHAETKQKELEKELEAVARAAKDEGESDARRQLELAQQQLQIQMQELQHDRAAMEYFKTIAEHGLNPPLPAQIREMTRKLRQADDDATRAELTDELEAKLNEYFDHDMQRREAELAKIEQRLAKLRSQLDRRRENRQEIVDLQMKVILNDAEGLGFFSTSPGGFGNDPFGGGFDFDPFFGHSAGKSDAPLQQPTNAPEPSKAAIPVAAPSPEAPSVPSPTTVPAGSPE